LKGYPYWTSGRFNTTSERWEWSNLDTQGEPSDEKPNAINIGSSGYGDFDYDLRNNPAKNPKGSCLLVTNSLSMYNGVGFSARFCSNAYRFICKRSLKVMLESTWFTLLCLEKKILFVVLISELLLCISNSCMIINHLTGRLNIFFW